MLIYHRFIATIYAWLMAPQSIQRIGLWRIGFGSVSIVSELLLLPHLYAYFANGGLLNGAWGGASWFTSPLDYFSPAWLITLLYILLLAATLSFTLGWRSRLAAVIVFALLFMFELHMPLLNYGGTRIQRDIFFWAMFLPTNQAYVFPGFIQGKPGAIHHWAIRLMQIQIVLVYGFTAVAKLLTSSQWRDGTYLYALLQNPSVAIWHIPFIHQLWLPLVILTFIALSLEFLFPVLVWFRRTNVWIVLAMMGLHLGIALTVNAVLFSPIMITLLLLCLRDDALEDARTLLKRVTP